MNNKLQKQNHQFSYIVVAFMLIALGISSAILGEINRFVAIGFLLLGLSIFLVTIFKFFPKKTR